MAEHFATFALTYSRESSGPSGIHPQTSWITTQEALALEALPDPTISGLLNPGVLQLDAYGLPNGLMPPAVHVVGRLITNDAGGGPPVFIESHALAPYWAIDGAFTANGAQLAIRPTAETEYARTNKPLELAFSGDALTAINALDGDPLNVNVTTHWQYPPNLTRFGLQTIGGFVDIPPNSAANGAAALEALLRQIQTAAGGSFVLGVTSGGQTLRVYDCGYAGLSPAAAVIMRPEDVGFNAEQIPASTTLSNTAERFRFHPSVFLRRTAYLRALSRQTQDPLDITVGVSSQPITIWTIPAALPYSDWVISVDGATHLVRVPHPQGSDLRRPRDIWNQVWVPILAGSQSGETPVEFLGLDGVQTGVGAVGSRLRYLEYARMLVPAGGTLISQLPPG